MPIVRSLTVWFQREDWAIAPAIIRVGVAAVLFSMYALHYQYRDFIWGPNAFISHEMFVVQQHESGAFSLYQLYASELWFETLFHVGLVLTVAWAIGLHTRLTGILTYLFTLSLWERNPQVLDGGDNILVLVLFFLMFTRTDGYFALRRVGPALPGLARIPAMPPLAAPWRSAVHNAGTILHNAAMVAIIAQVSILYLTSALFKVQGEMWQNGTALYYILRVQEFTWPGVSAWFYENAFLVTIMTYVTVIEQLSYPFMLLNRWTKLVSVFVVINMHMGIGLLMGLVSFSTVMIALQAAPFRDGEFLAVAAKVRSLAGRMRGRRWQPALRLPRPLPVRPRWLASLQAGFGVMVYYDSWCPRCRRIRDVVSWCDWLGVVRFTCARDDATSPQTGVAPARLLSRMHVRNLRTGSMTSGARAFAVVALRLPVMAPLSPLLAIASVAGGEALYDRFARARPIVPLAACDEVCVLAPDLERGVNAN